MGENTRFHYAKGLFPVKQSSHFTKDRFALIHFELCMFKVFMKRNFLPQCFDCLKDQLKS